VIPIHPKLDEVDKFITTNSELIDKIEIVDKEEIHSFIIDLIHITAHVETYVINFKRDSLKLNDGFIEVKQQLSLMKILRLSEILDIHA